jgi:ATP-binding cassette subfamily B protein/subfamily B ATP-binding cassette protein MsbA
MGNLLRAMRFYRAERGRVGLVFALLLCAAVAGLLRPWPLALMADYLAGQRPLPVEVARWLDPTNRSGVILGLALASLVLHLLHAAFAAAQNYASIAVSLRGLSGVRTELFRHLQRLPWRFHQRIPAGELVYRASWDAYAVQTLFHQGLVTFATALVSLVLMTGVMVRLDPGLTGIALLTAPALVGVIRCIGPRMSRRGGEAQQADSGVTSRVQQAIQSMPLIQSFTRERAEDASFESRVESARRVRLSQHGSELLYGAAVAAVFAVGAAATVAIGGRKVLAGAMTLGDLLVFLAYLAQLYEPLNQLSHLGATFATAGASAGRVFEILDQPCEPADPASPSPFPAPVRGSETGATGWPIRFESVTFAYRKGEPVIREVSFEAAPGEVIAIVGPSGAGKSTLLHLLPRFYDPDAGAVSIDGVDVRRFAVEELRRRIGVVFQEQVLWPGTVAENIGLGRVDATREQVESAARRANAHEFIVRLPSGYDTVIGDGAARLSVGEKQRISLARAFLKDAPILLLDEPTSALDAASERWVIDGLGVLMRGRTTFMVAHRLETLRGATRVVELREGRVVSVSAAGEFLRARGVPVTSP